MASWPWTPDTNNYGFEQVLLTKHGKYFCIYIRCIIPRDKFTTPFPSRLEFETSSKVRSKSVPQVVSLVFTFLHPQVDHNMYLDSVSRMIIFLWQICLEGIDISLPKRFVVCQCLGASSQFEKSSNNYLDVNKYTVVTVCTGFTKNYLTVTCNHWHGQCEALFTTQTPLQILER